MNKLLYLQLNRPAFLSYKINYGQLRKARNARYNEKLAFLDQIHIEIAPKVKKLWEDEEKAEAIQEFEQLKSANRRKTDGVRTGTKTCEGMGYRVHSGNDDLVMLKFPSDKEKREVEIKIED